MRKLSLRPPIVLLLGFAAIIAVGAVLLCLPAASADGESMGLIDSLFTATSAVCVTGLIVVDTGLQLSLFGHVVLLALIQIGGMGFMTAALILFFALNRRVSLKDRLVLQEAFNQTGTRGIVMLVRKILRFIFLTELCGAVLLCVRFVPLYGPKGLWYALFHSVSAFCNAGFDLFGGGASLTGFAKDPFVLIVIALLIIIGGLGFVVMLDLAEHKRTKRLSLQTKVVLFTSGLLLGGGTLLFLFTEGANPQTLGPESFGHTLTNAFFQSVTARTAGFNSIDQNLITPATLLFTVVLMFIGASPASTGGGLKTTTLAVLVLSVRKVIRGREDVECFGRQLSSQLVSRAIAIIVIYLVAVFASATLIAVFEQYAGSAFTLDGIIYNTVSAFGTVGMAVGDVADFSVPSRLVLIFGMYAGRLGPLTLLMAFSGKTGGSSTRFPEEKIAVG